MARGRRTQAATCYWDRDLCGSYSDCVALSGAAYPMTEGEIGAVLSILNAYKDDGTKKQQPWHITEAGWRIYLMHPNSQIQKAAWQHPECPAKIVAEIHSLIKELEWQTA